MKKSDLQNFDIVETRNELLFLVNADSGVLYGDSGWMSLDNYKDDLTDAEDCGRVSGFDIVRVKRPKQTYGLCSWADHPIIWERKEVPELSSFERALLENTKMKHVARNKNGNLAFFENEPFKDHSSSAWTPRGGESGKLKSNILVDIFAFITWEDSEPWSVEELLREAQ